MRVDSRDLPDYSTADENEREPDLEDLDFTRYNFNEEAETVLWVCKMIIFSTTHLSVVQRKYH